MVSMSPKPRREPITKDLRDALLQGHLSMVDFTIPEGLSLVEQLEHLQSHWTEVLAAAQHVVDNNPLTPIVIRDMIHQLGRKSSTAKIVLDRDGSAHLDFGEIKTRTNEPKPKPKAKRQPKPKPAPKRVGKLPSLGTLREYADKQGIDISDLGRSKVQIVARLNWVEPEPKPEPKPAEPDPKPVEPVVEQPPRPEPEPDDTSVADYLAHLGLEDEGDDEPIPRPPPRPKKPIKPIKPIKHMNGQAKPVGKCPVCGTAQHKTPSGIVCKNGHGGLDPADEKGFLDEKSLENVRRSKLQVITPDRRPPRDLNKINEASASLDLDKAFELIEAYDE
jgi:hypothetical protein